MIMTKWIGYGLLIFLALGITWVGSILISEASKAARRLGKDYE